MLPSVVDDCSSSEISYRRDRAPSMIDVLFILHHTEEEEAPLGFFVEIWKCDGFSSFLSPFVPASCLLSSFCYVERAALPPFFQEKIYYLVPNLHVLN